MTQRLPNPDLAFVDDDKLTRYLFNLASREGSSKGRFLTLNGFSESDLASVKSALIKHGVSNRLAEVTVTQYGTKYRVDGPIVSPSGKIAWIRTVWQIDTGHAAPRFVTFKPIGIST